MSEAQRALDEIEALAETLRKASADWSAKTGIKLPYWQSLAVSALPTLRAALAPVADDEVGAIRGEAIRIQSEMDFASLSGIGHPKFEGQSKMLPMVFTLLRRVDRLTAELSAERARADKAEALMDARYDLAYANGFRAGWNNGVKYEHCQPVLFERQASGNPEEYLQALAAMDRRSADALAVITAATITKDTQDE